MMNKYFQNSQVYLVTIKELENKENKYKIISIEKSLKLLDSCNLLQFDTETNGRDAHVCELLTIQFGSRKHNFQIVIDCSTIDVLLYKDILENKVLVGQNLKFDLKFLYNYGIIPRKIFDTMIAEQILFLGYSNNLSKEYNMSFSLKAIAERRLEINLDKTIRGQIIWRGLDDDVIIYAANDVKFLEDIMEQQIEESKIKENYNAIVLECKFVPVIAYLEWCGIKLDIDKWKLKMQKDLQDLQDSEEALNKFVINEPRLKRFVYVNLQGDLFEGFDTSPKVNILWSSSQQVVEVVKLLGFDTKTTDKKTKEEKESAMEKHLKKQKGICDEFLRLYFGKGEEGNPDYYRGYSGSAKVVSSFGQTHIDAINPKTDRIHTEYRQIGADTGRITCGSKNNNTELAHYKNIPECKFPNIQQLPHDKLTRSCFICDKGNKMVSCDYSAIESRLGADIYHEESMIKEFLEGSGDMHSLVAKMIFKELKDISIKDIKKKYPHLRTKAKPVEFSQQFGGSAMAIQNAMGCSKEEAEQFAKAYANGFKGIAQYKRMAAATLKKTGYIVLCPLTGHKTFWPGHEEYKQRLKMFTTKFWDEYRMWHKPAKDDVAKMVSNHFQEVSKWERKSLNSPTQGLGAVILKDSQIRIFNWVIKNGLFGKVRLCALVHDECVWEYPEELDFFPNDIVKKNMEDAAARYCKSLPIPAEPEISNCWVH